MHVRAICPWKSPWDRREPPHPPRAATAGTRQLGEVLWHTHSPTQRAGM